MPSNFDIGILRTFALIAEGRTFAETASTIGRSQSAVSLQIRALERDLGTSVFCRTGARAVLTAAGERLLAHARRILYLNDEALRAREVRSTKTIGLGLTYDLANALLPSTLAAFAVDYPDVDITLRIGPTSGLIAALRRQEIDIALGLNREDALCREIIFETRMLWAGRAGFELPSDGRVPLALRDGLSLFRLAPLDAMRDGYEFRIATSGCDTAALFASASAGLSITTTIGLALSSPLIDLGTALKLPQLPILKYALYTHSVEPSPIRDELIHRLKTRIHDRIQSG